MEHTSGDVAKGAASTGTEVELQTPLPRPPSPNPPPTPPTPKAPPKEKTDLEKELGKVMKLKTRYLTISSKTSSIRTMLDKDAEWDWARSAAMKLMTLDDTLTTTLQEQGLSKFLHNDGSLLKRTVADVVLLKQAKSFNELEEKVDGDGNRPCVIDAHAQCQEEARGQGQGQEGQAW